MATKSRRPVVFTTPPSSKVSSAYTPADKQSLLDNFDLEGKGSLFSLFSDHAIYHITKLYSLTCVIVADKTRNFRDSLSARLKSFQVRQETELLKIPRELRNMSLGSLVNKWGGSWAGTLMRIKREEMEEVERKEREKEEEGKEKEKLERGKRSVVFGWTPPPPSFLLSSPNPLRRSAFNRDSGRGDWKHHRYSRARIVSDSPG